MHSSPTEGRQHNSDTPHGDSLLISNSASLARTGLFQIIYTADIAAVSVRHRTNQEWSDTPLLCTELPSLPIYPRSTQQVLCMHGSNQLSTVQVYLGCAVASRYPRVTRVHLIGQQVLFYDHSSSPIGPIGIFNKYFPYRSPALFSFSRGRSTSVALGSTAVGRPECAGRWWRGSLVQNTRGDAKSPTFPTTAK